VNEEAMVRVGPQRHKKKNKNKNKKKKKKKKKEEEEEEKKTVVIRNTHFRSFVPTHGISHKKLVTCYRSWSCFERLRIITRCSVAVLRYREQFCSLLLEM
jgi:hypothetical protein